MPGKIADALIRGGLLGDFGRQALGAIDEAAVVGSSLGRSVLAGTNGLLRLAATGDPDAAAARVEEVEADPALTYEPRTQEARENFAQVGDLIGRASNAVANTKTGHSINDFLYEGSAQNPLLYAAAAGALNLLGGPEGRAAKAAERAAIRAADFAEVKPKQFREAINSARSNMGAQDRAQVSALPDGFKGRVFLTPDGKSGFGVDKSGELISLFRDPSGQSGVMGAALERGRAEGATHLNAFDTYLAKGYGKRGAVERERAPFNEEFAPEGWDTETMGRPDYVTMDLEKDRDVFTHENLLENPGRQQDIERYSPRKVPAYAQRLEENEDAFKQLTEWAKSGMNEEGLGWYNTEEMRKSFLNELGPDEGQRAYEMYIDLVAATSAGAKTPANAKIAGHYYYHGMRGNGAPMPVKGSGYGHKAQNLHNRGASEIVEGRTGLLAIQNPKRFTFAENLKGNWDHVTVDKHNVRALGMASRDPEFLATKLEDVKAAKQGRVQAPDWWNESQHGKWNPKTFSPRNWFAKHGDNIEWEKLPPTWFRGTPSKTDYASLERVTKRLAKELGTTPAQAQAALWLGAGERTGLGSPPKAFAKIFHDRIKATAKRDGISQEQALRDVIRAKRMLGTADPNLLLRLSAGGGLVGLLGVAAGHTGRDKK